MNDRSARFQADYLESRSRLTTFFRLLLAIPHLLLVALYGIAAFVAVIVAWFALLVTGRWPAGLYGFVAGFMRYMTRVYAYTFLLTDAYPGFGLGEDPEYPVRLQLDPPRESYSRLKVLLRIFYVIPAYIIQYVLLLMAEIVAFIAWFVIVFTGKQPRGLQDLTQMGVSYWARTTPLFLLLTEGYPPITDEPRAQLSGGATERPVLP